MQRATSSAGVQAGQGVRPEASAWQGDWAKGVGGGCGLGQQVVALTSPMARAFQGIIQRLRGNQSAHTKAYTTSVPR